MKAQRNGATVLSELSAKHDAAKFRRGGGGAGGDFAAASSLRTCVVIAGSDLSNNARQAFIKIHGTGSAGSAFASRVRD